MNARRWQILIRFVTKICKQPSRWRCGFESRRGYKRLRRKGRAIDSKTIIGCLTLRVEPLPPPFLRQATKKTQQ